MSAPANLLPEWAALLIEGLASSGVTDVILSPGSRSTPWVMAAAAHPGLRCHTLVDERTAGFFALGLAKVTGRPPLLLCTSGTAGAHYLPAIIEASLTHTPLLVLTADRPFELQHCGASQTMDQVKLFGDHVRLYLDLGMPDETDGALRWLRHRAAHAVGAASSPVPGVVHLNARARKPLEPSAVEGVAERDLTARVRTLGAQPTSVFTPRVVPSEAGVEALVRACQGARRGLIVCGPGPVAQASARKAVRALALHTGFPLLCEAASQLRFATEAGPQCDAFDALCRSPAFAQGHPPDLILQLGAPPTSGGWESFLAAHLQTPRWVLGTQPWADPQSAAQVFLVGPVQASVEGVVAGLRQAGHAPEPSSWAAEWSAANAVAWREVDAVLAAAEGLSEAAAVRATVRSVPRGGLLSVGNSLPIREVDSFCPAGVAECEVLSQRGAAGIDGLISSAAGAAASGRPTTLLLGDVSFLHDVGGLAAARGVTVPLPIVVINNDGGRMFEQLPVASSGRLGAPLEHWTTPHGLSPAAAGPLYGVAHQRLTTLPDLERALTAAQGRAGCTLLEVVVPPHSATELYRSLRARLEGAFAHPPQGARP